VARDVDGNRQTPFLKTRNRPQEEGQNMIKEVLLVTIITSFLSCTATRYFLVSHDKIKQDISTYGSLPAKRYLILPGEYKNAPLTFILNEPSKSVIDFLLDGQLKKAKKHLINISYEDKISVVFASALVYLFEGNFDSCNIFIQEMSDFSQNCFIQFLTADCEYERARVSGNIDYKLYRLLLNVYFLTV